MNPSILLIGIVTFLFCFFMHVIWWRCQRPKNDISVLFLIFFLIPLIFSVFAIILRMPFFNIISIDLLHVALSSAYIMSYPAAQAGCPSLDILLIVSGSMPKGIEKEEIKILLGSDILLDISIQQMIEEGLVKEADNKIIPTKFGNLAASFFILFRSFLGLKQGSG